MLPVDEWFTESCFNMHIYGIVCMRAPTIRDLRASADFPCVRCRVCRVVQIKAKALEKRLEVDGTRCCQCAGRSAGVSDLSQLAEIDDPSASDSDTESESSSDCDSDSEARAAPYSSSSFSDSLTDCEDSSQKLGDPVRLLSTAGEQVVRLY